MSASADDTAANKSALRRELLAARRHRHPDPWTVELRDAAVLAIPAIGQASVVAGYVALPGEPDLGPVLATLRQRGVRVLLPAVKADRDLDFAELNVAPSPGAAPISLALADVVLVPAVAADRRGYRLGRGGGSYDRALPRARPDALTVAVVHPEELLEEIPVEPHDVRLRAVLAGMNWIRTPE